MKPLPILDELALAVFRTTVALVLKPLGFNRAGTGEFVVQFLELVHSADFGDLDALHDATRWTIRDDLLPTEVADEDLDLAAARIIARFILAAGRYQGQFVLVPQLVAFGTPLVIAMKVAAEPLETIDTTPLFVGAPQKVMA